MTVTYAYKHIRIINPGSITMYNALEELGEENVKFADKVILSENKE